MVAGPTPLYVAYHDTEWGVARAGPAPRAMGKLVLDGFQAGVA